MFKFKMKFDQIVNFTILNSFLFGVGKDKKLVRYDFAKSKMDLLNDGNEINYLFPYSKTIIGLKINGEAIQFDKELSPLRVIRSAQLARLEYQTPYIVGYRGKIFEREFGVFSLDDNVFKWSRKDIKSLEQIEENFIGQWQFVLTKYSRDTGEIEWVHDFSDAYPQLKNQNGYVRPIGLAKDILVLGIDKIDRIFGMDINTGEIIWEKHAITSGKKLDKEKRVFHSFLINYTQLSLDTGEELKSIANRDYFEKEIGIETQRDNYVIIGDYIVTTDSRKGKIGAFNTNTGRFDWVHEVEGVSFPAGRDMVYSAPYLFVYDFDSNLHVFEKVD